MSVPVLTAFAGVLVAAVVTGVLAGRCVRRPRIGFVAWTAATLALTIALAAQSMGFASGFGPATFRVVQLFAVALVPLWLGWGLVELVVTNETARFGARLTVGALTVVGSVILATDPLTAVPFGKSWPPASLHFQSVAHYTLDAVQAVAVVVAAAGVATAVARAGNGPRGRPALMAAAASGLAVAMTAGMRFWWPASAAYPLSGLVAAALVWFGASKLGARSLGGSPVGGPGHSGDRPADEGRPADTSVPDDQYVTYGQRAQESQWGQEPHQAQESHWAQGSQRVQGSRDGSYRGPGPAGAPAANQVRPAAATRLVQRRPAADVRMVQHRPAEATGTVREAGAARAVREAGAGSGPQAQPGGAAAAPAARPYGRILIFTLLEERAADFDRLAEQTAEEVRTGEPDTLVYVIHLVPNAPMQRIFYEIYRDRPAFDRHESQPYMQRFAAERRSCVLATNVIELRLKYAMVAPLPASRPHQPAPYQPSPYQQDDYQQGHYQQDDYQQGHYHQGHYQQGHYQQGPYQQPSPPRPDPRERPSAARRHGGI